MQRQSTPQKNHRVGRRPFRRRCVTAVLWSAGKLQLLSKSLVLPTVVLTGKEKHGQTPLIIKIIGADSQFIAYLSDIAYHEPPQVSHQQHISLWGLGTRGHQHTADLTFLRIDRFFTSYLQTHGYITMPEWITMTLNLTHDLDVSRNISRIISEIPDDYSYTVSTDLTQLHSFYHHMYMPYIRQRFGPSAYIPPFTILKSILKEGHLLLIKKGDTTTLGILIRRTSPSSAALTHIGVLNPENETNLERAGPISTHFSILWAHDHHITDLDLGICRGFLNDGVLQHKRRWNAAVQPWKQRQIPDHFSVVVGLRLGEPSEGQSQCLYHNPFLYLDHDDQLHGLICIPPDHALDDHELQHLKKTFTLPGLVSLAVTTPLKLRNHEAPMMLHTKSYGG